MDEEPTREEMSKLNELLKRAMPSEQKGKLEDLFPDQILITKGEFDKRLKIDIKLKRKKSLSNIQSEVYGYLDEKGYLYTSRDDISDEELIKKRKEYLTPLITYLTNQYQKAGLLI